MGKMFIEEWEREFGENTYYLADSFNEMQLPFGKDEAEKKHQMLAEYGRQIYSAIESANPRAVWTLDRKSTRLNSSHANISYAVFCLKKKKNKYKSLYDMTSHFI